MRRRDFIRTLGAIAAAPVLARAEQPAMPVIGFLNATAPGPWAARVAAFRRGLGEVGYVEGENVAIEYRWAEGHYDRLSQLARDLVSRGVAVIVAGGNAASRATKQATASIPIVFTAGVDPVASGMVASLNRPGANVTGINLLASELRTKRLEVLRDLVPAAKVIAILGNPSNPSFFDKSAVSAAAQGMGLEVAVFEASSESEIDRAFTSLAERRADVLLVDADAFFQSRRDQLIELAARQKIPAIFNTRDFPDVGGLISYGPDYAVAYREAGVYAGRILRGAKPAELPVAQLSKVELVVNAKTAKALGLTIPPAILTRADEVIE